MSGETVIYKNEMNLVPLRRFTAIEINLFFAMCNKLKEQDTNTLHLSFDELKELSNGSVAKIKLYAHLYKTIKANIVLTVKSFVSINYFSFFSINIT
ncbi:RepB family plasmid replication initiator protein [Staphylococcus epidermidis]|uniref:RepB family plasmid replication initiator protein n=1 Tax=Staphylococcus epidermidis TaxID=1282 RepID=UPI002DB7DAA9|nr:RepB family plasmid replication initiator protein [Staphylococcus epidermidis]MEB6251498.1 RepB family plasmid replication initiator protein [Staphylococcus epidermidis]